ECTIHSGSPAPGFTPGPGPPGALFHVTVTDADIISCLVINRQEAASLTLVKVVHNLAGAASPSEWTLTATGTSAGSTPSLSGPGPTVSSPVLPGTYALSESHGPTPPPSYTASAWVCTGTGFTQTGASVAVTANGHATCTITNSEVP